MKRKNNMIPFNFLLAIIPFIRVLVVNILVYLYVSWHYQKETSEK